MKKIGFLGLLLLTLLVFAVAWVSKSEGAAAAAKATKIDKEEMEGMIRPTLEKYVTNHPDANVRIWSMVILTNISKIDQQKVFSLPTLIQQMSSKDESIRLVALDAIRQAMTLDDEQWKGVMAPILLNLVKTSKYKEVRSQAIQTLAALQKMNKEQLGVLPLLFELAQDNDREIRQLAKTAIDALLEEKK